MNAIELWPPEHPNAKSLTEETPSLTPYLLNSDKPLAAVIVLPGGGYVKRAEHEGEPVAEWLNGIGLHAFVLHYRVAPHRHPVPLHDAKRAVRLVRSRAAELGVDPDRIGILGFSAGGHLAATLGTHFDPGSESDHDPVERVSSRPDLLVLCYPVISFGEHRHHGSLVSLLGEDAPEELRRHLSNELQVTPDTPPSFLWHTADDGAVPVENSYMFAAALSRSRVPHELHVYESGRHGLGLAGDHPEAHTWTSLCRNWLSKRGFIEAAE